MDTESTYGRAIGNIHAYWVFSRSAGLSPLVHVLLSSFVAHESDVDEY